MHYFIAALMATQPPVLEKLSGSEICEVVEYQLHHAQDFDLISKEQMSNIMLRCFVDFS